VPPIEQRVVSSQKIGQKIGGSSASVQAAPAAPEEKPRRRRGRVLVVLAAVVVLLALGAAAYLLLVRDDGTPAAEPSPEPGAVLQVEPVSLNLQGGHYLRLGLGLQLTKDVGEAPDPARAVDLAIALFSGRSVEEVSDPATREQLRDELADQLAQAYDGEVMGVYLTNYVTQ